MQPLLLDWEAISHAVCMFGFENDASPSCGRRSLLYVLWLCLFEPGMHAEMKACCHLWFWLLKSQLLLIVRLSPPCKTYACQYSVCADP